MSDAYAAAGVDTGEADRGVAALVGVLRGIDSGRAPLSVPLPGHYASVVRLPAAPGLGIALATDSVGSKVIVAEQARRFDTIGIDCVAMNVNDLICVGAEPLALLDYIAVERADPALLGELAVGLRAGAEAAGVEIPGGEVCQIPEVLRGHPSPFGFDLVGSAFGTVALDEIVDGAAVRPGDALIGLPASGVHSNGLTLARRALLQDGGLSIESRPPELGGATVADVLLEPTVIYVRAALALLRSEIEVRGLAHITGGGLMNLLRIGSRRRVRDSRAAARAGRVSADRRSWRCLRGRDVGGLQHGLRDGGDGSARPRGRGGRAAGGVPPRNGRDRVGDRPRRVDRGAGAGDSRGLQTWGVDRGPQRVVQPHGRRTWNERDLASVLAFTVSRVTWERMEDEVLQPIADIATTLSLRTRAVVS